MRSTLFTLAVCNLALLCAQGVEGAPVYDHAAGTWKDDYSDGSGLENANGVAVDPGDGRLKLTNSSGGFSPPYAAAGEAITTTIIPVSVAAWTSVTLSRQLPAGTSLTLQVLDETEVPYPDSLLAGNQAGFTGPAVSLTPLPVESVGDIQNTKSAKFARLRLKLTLKTSDVNSTPALDDVTLSWSTTSGDLSASPLLDSTWPIPDVDAQGTRHTTARADPVHLIVRWAKLQPSDFGGTLTRGSGGAIFNKTNGGPGGLDGKLSEIDRRSGATVWERPISGNDFSDIEHTVSQNQTVYISDLPNDILLAYDAEAEGSLKWTHQFMDGHGNQKVALGADGTIFTIRTQQSSPEPESGVYAFNSDGSLKWRRALPSAPSESGASQIIVAPDGTLHFVFGAGESSLYFLDPATGNDKESPYPIGASLKPTPLVGSDGTIYVANDSGEMAEKKIRAIGADRTLEWERSIGQTTDHWIGLSLRSDGLLLAEKVSACCSSTAGAIEAIDAANGTLAWERPTVSNNDAFVSDLFSDSLDGFFVRTVLLSNRTDLYYFDSGNRQKWHLERVAAAGEHVRLLRFIQDENGAVYGNLLSLVAGVPNNQVIGLFPWTLSTCVDRGGVGRAGSRRINIETSMPRVDPLSGEDNQVQVLIDTGDKVPATYVGDSAGGSRWTADLGASQGITRGTHEFTVEANAAGIETDIPVHMSSPAIGSNNTGVTATGRFTKLRSGIVWRGLERCHRSPAGRATGEP